MNHVLIVWKLIGVVERLAALFDIGDIREGGVFLHEDGNSERRVSSCLGYSPSGTGASVEKRTRTTNNSNQSPLASHYCPMTAGYRSAHSGSTWVRSVVPSSRFWSGVDDQDASL